MKKYINTKTFMLVLFVTCLLISNVVTNRMIQMPFGLMVAGAVVIYPITFLITDIAGEIYGKEFANEIVVYGFIAQVIATLLIFITGKIPSVNEETNNAFQTLLGTNWIIVLGSLAGYSFSQWWDVWVFHKIRDAYIKKHGTVKGGRWIWNNASTITSQFFDTIIFILIAFGFGQGWVQQGHWDLVWSMMIGQYILKVICALLDTPFFYLFTQKHTKEMEQGLSSN